MSANTLGFLLGSFGFLLCIWVVDVSWRWWSRKNLSLALRQSRATVAKEVTAWILFIVVAESVFIIRTIAFDHRGLRYEETKNAELIAQMTKNIQHKRHYMPIDEPVFINMRDLLAGFAVFHHYIEGESCSIKVTAPPESYEMAESFAMFSNVTSGCFTSGPTRSDPDPTLTAQVTAGMVPNAIVIHAPHSDDKAVNELIGQFANRVLIIRRYDTVVSNYVPPQGGFKHSIWFQFGDKVRWSSDVNGW